jgi:hypothetical protein
MTTNLIEKQITDAIEKIRPPVEVRKQLDFGYTYENNAVLLLEIRPNFINEDEIMQRPIAKIKFVKSKNIWKLYWMRGNLTWLEYTKSNFTTIQKAFKVIEKDEDACFFG